MEIEGVVYSVLPPVKGRSARGDWSKQEVVFDLPGEFNRKLCVEFWGDKADDAASLRVGDKVSVSFNVESRENNGRWYTSVRAWKMQRAAAAQQPPVDNVPPIESEPVYGEPSGGNDMPF